MQQHPLSDTINTAYQLTIPCSALDRRGKNTFTNYRLAHTRSIPMASLVPHLSFEHQHSLARPSCHRCGQLCLLPERTQYLHGRVCSSWQCDSCHTSFETSAAVPPVGNEYYSLT